MTSTTHEDLLRRVKAALAKARGQELSLRDLRDGLDVPADERKTLRTVLAAAVDAGELSQEPGRKYGLPRQEPVVEGTVHRHPKGFGWLTGTGAKDGDPFIPPEEMEGLLHGDVVKARILPGRAGKFKAAIVQVVTRNPRAIGTVRRNGKFFEVELDGIRDWMLLQGVPSLDVKEGLAVEVEVVERSLPMRKGTCKILRILGKAGALHVEVEKLVSVARVPVEFPPDVDRQMMALTTDIMEHAKADPLRRDIRDVALVTIDGETAKDFDDAVHVERTAHGFILTVAIADVSAYVEENSALDQEAASRGTSIYFPGRVIPMLPPRLSDDLCSLRPQVPRLCMVARMEFAKGAALPEKVDLFSGLMQSRARLTYSRVQEGLTAGASSLPEAPGWDLTAANELFRVLRKARLERGALDLDLPEPDVRLDENGEPSLMRAAPRLDAHMLIEDFMIAANEAVARWFEERSIPCVYRIHEPPDPAKLERFRALTRIYARGTHLPENPSAKDLGAFVANLAGTPQHAVLQSFLLRSLMQARYSVESEGHFGLASTAYLHFTSPIRRYPDLLVHRELRRALTAGKRKHHGPPPGEGDPHVARLTQLAEQSSKAERRATDLERQLDSLYAARYCQQHVGELLEGTVTGISDHGVHVLMTAIHAEGMLPAEALGAEDFVADEHGTRITGARSGRVFGLGQAVKVRIMDINLSRRQVTLALEDAHVLPPKRELPGGDRRPMVRDRPGGAQTSASARGGGAHAPSSGRPGKAARGGGGGGYSRPGSGGPKKGASKGSSGPKRGGGKGRR